MAEQKQPAKKEKQVDWLRIAGVSQDEEAFCEWMKTQVTDHPVVRKHHGKWAELIEWEEGEQFSLWNDDARAVVPVDLKVRKKKVVINLMKPLNETIEGKLNFYHKLVGVPNSGETKDMYGSQVATKLLSYNDYVNAIDDLMEEMKHDLLRPGTSCIKWWWDENGLGMVAPRKNGKTDTSNSVKEPGEVTGDVVPIFNIRTDPTAKKPKDLRWVMEIKEVSRQVMMETFKLSHRALDEMDEDRQEKEKGRYVIGDEVDEDVDTYIVREFWEKTSKDYANGRYIVSCQNKVLYKGKNPCPQAKLPYFFFFYRKSSYSFWAKGPLYYIQDIQREFNRMVSMISEHLEAWRPKMAVGHGALKRARSMTVDAFEIVEVDFSRGEPRPIPMPELSQHVTAYRDFLISAVDRVSNVHEVSYSRLPQYASRAPASLYSMMLEQENVKLSPMVKRINQTVVDMAQFRLQLMDQHYTMPRKTKIIGEQRKATVEYFDKADLNESYDVRLEIGVSLNQSKTIEQRLIFEMWDKGLLTEQDRPKILEIVNLGTAEHDLRADLADKERAIRENQAFLDGTQADLPVFQNIIQGRVLPSMVYKHDHHEIHLDQHTTLVKSEEFDKMKDDAKRDINLHIEEHYVWFQFQMQMAQQAAGPGSGAAAASDQMGGGTGMPGPAGGQEPQIEGAGGPGEGV